LSDTEPTVKINATVTQSQADFLREVGDGVISRGVRRLVDTAKEQER